MITNPGSVYIYTEYLLPTQRHKYRQVLFWSFPFPCEAVKTKERVIIPVLVILKCLATGTCKIRLFKGSGVFKIFFSCKQPKKKISVCWCKHLGFSQIQSFFFPVFQPFSIFPTKSSLVWHGVRHLLPQAWLFVSMVFVCTFPLLRKR